MASEKTLKFIEEIKALSVLELAELVEAIQEEFGVTAAVAAAPAAAGAVAEEKTEFDVVMTSFGEAKMNVIKAIKDVMGLGLKNLKSLLKVYQKQLKKVLQNLTLKNLKQNLKLQVLQSKSNNFIIIFKITFSIKKRLFFYRKKSLFLLNMIFLNFIKYYFTVILTNIL